MIAAKKKPLRPAARRCGRRAVLTTAIVLVGPVHLVAGHPAANLMAYRVAFLVAAAVCLLAVPCALSIRDSDAARTIPVRRGAKAAEAPAGSPGVGWLARPVAGLAARADSGRLTP